MKKIRSLKRRPKALINNFDPIMINLLKKRVCFFLYDVLNEKIRPPLNDFYELKVSKINARNNGYVVKLLKTQLEYGRVSLKFMGEKIVNDPPLENRKQCFDKSFKSGLKSYLASN